jgi:hypothetical protein
MEGLVRRLIHIDPELLERCYGIRHQALATRFVDRLRTGSIGHQHVEAAGTQCQPGGQSRWPPTDHYYVG